MIKSNLIAHTEISKDYVIQLFIYD